MDLPGYCLKLGKHLKNFSLICPLTTANIVALGGQSISGMHSNDRKSPLHCQNLTNEKACLVRFDIRSDQNNTIRICCVECAITCFHIVKQRSPYVSFLKKCYQMEHLFSHHAYK